MKDSAFAEVFACYPDVKEIFVVGAMPFVVKRDAETFAASTGQKVDTIKRPGAKAAELPEATEVAPQEEGKKGKAKG